MAAKYFPTSDAQLVVWLENFSKVLPTLKTDLALTDAEAKEAVDAASGLKAAILTDEQKYAEWQALNARTATLRPETLAVIQRLIERAKASRGWGENVSRALMATPHSPAKVSFDASFAPTCSATLQGGKVRIHWTRGKLDGIRIERRLSGETTWTAVGIDMRPPFDDPTPLSKPGAPEHREYRVIGLYQDQDVGRPSDIVTITVGE